MNLIKQILSRREFTERPPILIDIGASGGLRPEWQDIAPYSICIAFDADDRGMKYIVKESSRYRKLYVYNRIVTDSPVAEADFFLTRSPYCSSLLKPLEDKLREWEFEDLFKVQRIARLKSVSLPQLLEELGVKHVDWFKTDSQGTDLRLFKSLGHSIMNTVIVAEFEPGIIDAYEGEDKLWQMMQYMEGRPFWMSDLSIKGSARVRSDILKERVHKCSFSKYAMRAAPGWGEMTFIHTFEKGVNEFGLRECLLGWVFAVVENQLGFALELAVEGGHRFKEPIFERMESYVTKRLKGTTKGLILHLLRRVAGRVGRILDPGRRRSSVFGSV
ncbi:MAG: hypothetical protein ABSH34_02220 [Verrucomicrobiota bacterium]|jgi:hypothetical protein